MAKRQTKALNPFTDIDYGAGWRKLWGDKSADVVPSMDNVKIADPMGAFTVVSGTDAKAKGGSKYTAPNKTTDKNKNTNDKNTNDNLQTNAAYQAFLQQQAQEAKDTEEAERLRDDILGRRDKVQNILDGILANIKTELIEAKDRRRGQFGRDEESLVSSLDAAIPDIENAFAAMGLTNSTYKGDRIQDTRDSYGKSWEDTNRQLNEDLAGYGKNAEVKRAEANTSARNAFDTIDSIKKVDANANNLSRFQRADESSRTGLSNFRGEKDKFIPGAEALKDISELDSDYDFGKTLDTFNTFATGNANPGSGNGVGGKSKAGNIYEKDDKKKNKTEVQINNPVGAASA